ncbi:MAG TPA: hypothetical protein VGO78_17250 [Acidimicrobiales bacterium]|jgi:hypothetical protein|nr:hypothetical protein [Acidimicrobiales bacterium]
MVGQVVDTARYPLSEPGSPAWDELVARVRDDLRRVGCSVLPDFVRPDRHETLRRQGGEVAPRAHAEVEVVNAYNIAPDAPLPDDHPGRVPLERGNGFVARDRIPPDFLIHRLYTDPLVQRFVAACVGLDAVHPLADPLAGLCLNVIPPGRAHPWHFDTNEFAVSILTQEAEGGGVFEYCPGIRSAGEENLAAVRSVLDGRGGDRVRRLALRPGALQLFTGRWSLHRVTTVEGSTARHSAILSYSERPGVVGSVVRTRQLFGRVLPEHVAAGRHPVRGDRLLD